MVFAHLACFLGGCLSSGGSTWGTTAYGQQLWTTSLVGSKQPENPFPFWTFGVKRGTLVNRVANRGKIGGVPVANHLRVKCMLLKDLTSPRKNTTGPLWPSRRDLLPTRVRRTERLLMNLPV